MSRSWVVLFATYEERVRIAMIMMGKGMGAGRERTLERPTDADART